MSAEPGRSTDQCGELVQILRPDGARRRDGEFAFEPDFRWCVRMLREMMLVRRLDDELMSLQRQGELGMWIPSRGQEAAQVGSVHAFTGRDYVFPSYREHAVVWARGVARADLARLFRGDTNGGWDPARHNTHLYAIVLGSQVLHAVGYAMGVQRDGAAACVAVYLGDGAMSQGDTGEALVWAASVGAPVVFVCQNNHWAISTPSNRQSRVPFAQRAAGFGIPGIRVDGNDVLAMYAVTDAMATAAREGRGPALIEAVTYRMGPHTTSDDPSRYRGLAEVEAWEARDPIDRLRRYLLTADALSEQGVQDIVTEADDAAAQLRRQVVTLPPPEWTSIFGHVYADGHPLLEEERREYAAYRASFLNPVSD